MDAETRRLLVKADSLLSLLWHRHVTPERKDVDLQVDVERTIGELRAASRAALPAEPPDIEHKGFSAPYDEPPPDLVALVREWQAARQAYDADEVGEIGICARLDAASTALFAYKLPGDTDGR